MFDSVDKKFKKLVLNYWIFPAILLQCLILLSVASTLSVSYSEVIIYENYSFISFLAHVSAFFFGQNDVAVKLPSILFICVSSWLIYQISSSYFKKECDKILSVIIFMSLSGINSAALMLNSASAVIFFTLLFLYLYPKNKKSIYLLPFMLLIDNAFMVLYLGLFFYALSTKDKKLQIVAALLFSFSLIIFGFDDGGKPKSYFIDTFGKFAGIFSPFAFLYFIYAIYRIGIQKKQDLLWYISATSLFLALLLSLRQKILIEDFAPFVVIAVPIALSLLLSSYRVRLKQFRQKYTIIISIIVIGLFINTSLIFGNKYLFLFTENYKDNFAYKHYFVKELAQNLKKDNITALTCENNTKLQKQLEFYGIRQGGTSIIRDEDFQDARTLTVSYFQKPIKHYYISK
jgi:hypothetical protein